MKPVESCNKLDEDEVKKKTTRAGLRSRTGGRGKNTGTRGNGRGGGLCVARIFQTQFIKCIPSVCAVLNTNSKFQIFDQPTVIRGN